MASFLPALISAAGSIGGGLLGSRGQKETKIQKSQRKVIDELLASLGGDGQFSDLFNSDEDAFQKSFVDPAMSKFRNQIAPGIQQQFISSGLQRGTGLEDSLSRAGVDLDSILNEQYMNFQQGAQNRQLGALSSILGQGAGAPPQLSGGDAFKQSLGGFLSKGGFNEGLASILDQFKGNQSQDQLQPAQLRRPGFR